MLRLVLVLVAALLASVVASADPLYDEIHGTGSYSAIQQKQADKKLSAVRKSFEPGQRLDMARKTDIALNAIFKIAIRNLRYRGYYEEARDMQFEWSRLSGSVERLVVEGRKIGDFDPLSKYLAVAYYLLEAKLGYDICRALRLSDIQTLNFCIKYCFSLLCQHDEKEFFFHFVHDDPAGFHPYRGLAPVVSYWLSVVSCSIATFGAGYFFICSPVGMLVEYGMDTLVAPALSPKVYQWSCKGGA